MTRTLAAIVERDSDGYVALCPEVEVASQGGPWWKRATTSKEALMLLFETASPQEIERRPRDEIHVTHVR